jgi:GTP-binding protein
MPHTEVSPRFVHSEFKAAATTVDQIPPPVTIEVAFAGRSNVGKSSLMNTLLERRGLVRTSSTPGCTRQLAFFEARTADGLQVVLVDLPGYGYARRSKAERLAWGELIEGYLLGRSTLRAVVVVIDARRGVEQEERDLFELIASPTRTQRPSVAVVIAATKLDKIPASQRSPALARLAREAGKPIVGFSAKDGTGRTELWQRLRPALAT